MEYKSDRAFVADQRIDAGAPEEAPPSLHIAPR